MPAEGAPPRRRRSTPQALVAALLVALPSRLPGAAPSAATPRFGASLEVVLRQARVLVQAPGRESPWNLSADDFRVREDGRDVELASVELVRVPRRTGQPGTEALREVAPLSRAESARIGARRWIVLFDSLNPGPIDSVERLKRDLKRFARTGLGPDDEMSIVFVGAQQITISPFLDDPERIAAEIDGQRLRPEDIPRARRVPEPQRGIDPRISDMRRGTVDSRSGAGPTPPPVAQQWLPLGARHFFGTDNLERRVSTGRYLRVIEDLGKSLRVVPGRKVLVVVSAGFPGSDLNNDPLVLQRFNLAVRNIMDSGTTVYTIDSSGLTSAIDQEVFSASHGYLNYSDPVAAEAGVGVDRLRDVANDFFDKQGGSFLLAHETGGEFFQGSSDFAQAFERIESREAGYYLVSWYSSSSDRPGSFRAFEVRVERPGYQVAGPRGYFLAKPFAKMDALEREADLLGLAEWGGERDDLPGESRVDVFPDGRGGAIAVVSAVLRAAELPARLREPAADALDLVVAAADARGGFRYWDRSSLSGAATAAIARGQWWHYVHGIPLAGDITRISLVMRENAGGRVLGRALEVPSLPAQGLTVPVRIRELKPLARSASGRLVRDPFDFAGIQLAPSDVNRLQPGEKLFVLFEAYGMGLGDDPGVTYALAGADGERPLLAGPAPEQVRESRVNHPGRDLVSVLARVPTTDLAAGDWELRVRVPGRAEARYPFSRPRF